MLKKTITLLIAVHFIITACGHSSDNSSTGSSQLSTTAPAINSNGEIVTTVNSTSGAKIAASSLQSSSNDPLSQLTSVEIPAGALSNAADIKIFETPSLAQNVTAASFGLTTISKAGPSIAIQSSATLSQPITVSVPYSLDGAKLLLAGQNLAVLVLSGSTVDLMTGDQINIGLNTVDVKVSKFGAFQVINYTGSVMQTTATSQISDSSLQSTTTVAAAAAAPAVTPTPTPTPAAPAPAATVEATPTPTPAVVPVVTTAFEGKWSNCNSVGSVFEKATVEFVGYKMTITSAMYSSAACTTLLYTDVNVYSFTLGSTLTAQGATPINETSVSYTVTPASTAGVQYLNANYSNSIAWQVGVGTNMFAADSAYGAVGDKTYDIGKVTGTGFSFGVWTGSPATAEAARPATLSTFVYTQN